MYKYRVLFILFFVFAVSCEKKETSVNKQEALAVQLTPQPVLSINIPEEFEKIEKVSEEAQKDFEREIKEMKKWAEEHVSDAQKRCEEFKTSLYTSDIDPKVKDFIWKGVVVSSEYCWEVDQPKTKNK